MGPGPIPRGSVKKSGLVPVPGIDSEPIGWVSGRYREGPYLDVFWIR